MLAPGEAPSSGTPSNGCTATSRVQPWAINGCAAHLPARSSLQLKTPYRYRTTPLVMTPLKFLQRLAALVPHPRLHLIRFHGVLAPNTALRSQIVPGEADPVTDTAREPSEPPTASPRARMSWAQLLKRIFAIDLTTCLQYGGPLIILAAIEAPSRIIKILAHLGLPTRVPPRTPARLDAFLQTT